MKNKGFSLVELIVVIAIMAILVGVAVPVYTSYIEKANAAKDEQLLGEINSAFNVVCAGTALDINTVTDATITVAEDGSVELDTMVVKVGSTEVAGFAAKMVEILGSGLKFNVIEEITYVASMHKFIDGTPAAYKYGDTTIYLSPADIAALKGSGFYTWGVGNILGNVDMAVGTLKGLENGSLFDLVYDTSDVLFGWSDTTKQTVEAMLGLDLDNEEDAAVYAELLMQKAEMLAIAAGKTADDASDYIAQANKEIGANATVLSVATGTTFDTNAYVNSLASGNGIVDVKEGEGTEQLAKIAMAYAMYTSYQTSLGKTVEGDPDINAVRDCIENDTGFQAYMKSEQGATDVQGYLSAMNMINDSTKDPNAVGQLLVNGFEDDNLENTLTGALG